jgi:hypothetical protein
MDYNFKILSIIIIMKNYQYFIILIIYFKHGLLKKICYKFMFKYLEMN